MATLIDRLLLQIEVSLHNAQTGMGALDKGLQKIGSGIAVADSKLNNFDLSFRTIQATLLGVGLSFLFTGMAIQRFFQGMLTSMFQTFLQVEGEGGVVNEQVNELKASLEFLKWSFIDAFAQTDAAQKWVDRIQGIIDWFTSLDESTQSNIVNWMIWGLIIGTVLMFVGQALLGLLGFLTLIAFIGGTAFLVLLVAIAGIIAIFLIWNSHMSTTEKVLWTIVVVLAVLIILAAIFLGLAALPFILVAAFIGILLVAFLAMREHLGSTKNAFLAFGIFVLAILAAIGDAILIAVLSPLYLLIAAINMVISASNKFLGTHFKQITLPEELQPGALSKAVWGLRNNLLAQAEAEKAGSETEAANATGIPPAGNSTTNIFNIDGLISQDNLDQLIYKINQTTGGGSPQQ